MKTAVKLLRKGWYKKSARSLLTEYFDNVLKLLKSGYNLQKMKKYLQWGMLAVDLTFNFSEKIIKWRRKLFHRFFSWRSYLFGYLLLPGGFWVSLGATILTICFEDEIEEFKDTFYNGWKDFWNFSWV